MPKDKVIHTRIENSLHEKIFEKCNELGCTISDFMINSLENSLENKPELDKIVSNILKPIESTPPRPEYRTKPRATINGIPSGKAIPQISYDNGKTWIDCPQ